MNRTNLIFLAVIILFALGYAAYKFLIPAKDPVFADTIVQISGGNQNVSLASLQGKVTIVAFFQTWCSDCIREMPTLIDLQNLIENTNVKVLMVTDESQEKVNAFQNRFPNFKFDYYISQKRLPEMGIRKYPTTYLLDSEGNIKLRTFEGYDWSNPQSVELIKTLLK